jgi:outer membrane receptor for ferrienterochelin and colicins
LFWRRDARSEGDPSLKPEHANSSHAEIGIVLDLKHTELEATMRWHQTDYTDLVIWRPDFRGVFRPVNLASAKISGRSDLLSLSLLDRLIHFSYANDLLDPRNRTAGIDFDQQLTFRPHFVTRLIGEVRTEHWEMKYSHEIVARRYATESNTRWYDAYHVTDLSAGFSVSHSSFNLRIGGEIRNLFNQSYAQIAHYPMPGRNAAFSVRLTFDPTANKK